jgi:hypothetical protein
VTVCLRQVAVAALDGRAALEGLHAVFGLSAGYQDPGVADFGLENHVFAVGDQFVELVSPVTDQAPVRKFLQKKGRSAAGYMVILEVDAVGPYRTRGEAMGCRVVLGSESATWSTVHFHPRDMGSLVSVDHDKGGDWIPAGPNWRERSGASAATGIAGVRIAAPDPMAMARRWAQLLDVPASPGMALHLRQGTIEFVPAAAGSDGLIAVDLYAAEEQRVGECHVIAGTEFRLVTTPPARSH